MKKLKFFWRLTIFVLIICGIVSITQDCFIKVSPGQRAVKTKWGEIVDTTYAPELVFNIPYSKSLGNNVNFVDIKPKSFQRHG